MSQEDLVELFYWHPDPEPEVKTIKHRWTRPKCELRPHPVYVSKCVACGCIREVHHYSKSIKVSTYKRSGVFHYSSPECFGFSKELL